jgi:5-hydroxyisourate hydrolase-like protein (transthyretin family)
MADQVPLEPGLSRLVFDTRRYFEARALRAFYPSVIITFEVTVQDIRDATPEEIRNGRPAGDLPTLQ